MIPEHAERVFSGEIFDVYQWDQELFDGSVVRFERAKRKSDTVLVIAATKDRMILTDEEQPGAKRIGDLPGGRCDGEDPLDAAKRELLEETGYASEDWEHYRTYDRFPKLEWKVHYYVARNCTRVGEPTLDPGERISVRLVSFEEWFEAMTEKTGDFTTDLLRMKLDGSLDALRSLALPDSEQTPE